MESMVSEMQELECVYGSLDDETNDGMATRLCTGNLMWDVYDGSTCVTQDTYRLRQLSSVSRLMKTKPFMTNCYIPQKIQLTAEDADEVIEEIAAVVNNLDQEDEQTEDNVELIAEVFGQIDGLIEEGELNASISVRTTLYKLIQTVFVCALKSLAM